MNYSRALEIIHELASGNQIDETDIAFGDEGLGDQRKWQEEALDTVDDLITNHHDALDARFALPDLTALKEHPIEQVAADRSMSPAAPESAVRIVLDLARGNLLEDPDMEQALEEQSMAVSLVEDFIVRHGGELSASMTSLRI